MSLHFHPLKVLEVRPDTDEAVIVSFAVPPELAETFRFTQGQYLTLRADVDGQDLRRSYSICAGVDDGELRVGVRKVDGGRFSTWINEQLKAGDEVQVFPPQGRFGQSREGVAGRHHVGIAAGSGITPILSIMKTVLAREPGSRFTLIYGNRRPATTMFKEEIEDLKNRYLTRVALHHVFSREATDAPLQAGRIDAGKLAAFFASLVPAAGIDEAYVCGPFEMNEAAEAVLKASGVAEEHIHVERFGTVEMQTGRPVPHEVREGDADAAIVTVIRDGVSREIEFSKTDPSILDAAARAGMDVPFSCKSGVCSTCRCKLLEGEVRMDKNFALDKHELAAGFILSCQAHALTPRVVISFDER
ncbi:1,2-phenylacetyl-CoA epoxidase subunit PaaE [Pelomonas sp. SE-A7]|uniref:1,2-phenylacetyl-CoA epoxidase subunit PaaE n=1 Tax=Pelomonas sp. SE-A7 TaxID=3054953 RepID=UPI00259D2E2A|nr:1,2-phenylacetyl-CoA epoxidase subunit PaaE [Pelomonas sp. SE-A7]MDM4765844.1 1,2-phenylacetyl-CoA epoxidase subunit PaaE [Pelomonas sp. SE-A7]